jgi:hypothetical protein
MNQLNIIHCIGLGTTLFVSTMAFVLLEPSVMSFGLFILLGVPGIVMLLEMLAAE